VDDTSRWLGRSNSLNYSWSYFAEGFYKLSSDGWVVGMACRSCLYEFMFYALFEQLKRQQ
jgi:hypothetical protein